MGKRLFDLTIALVGLVITFPLMLMIALAIYVDSPGPILYRSPRLGRGGKVFGMMRFRTVDIQRPTTLPMNERLTRVGRFIRDYSLDDLPNVFNMLIGDLSCVGPRPTEPERVDLADPIWQQILAVRPGMSPAILQLGTLYNASPYQVKQQLELAYVQNRSRWVDLQLFWQGIRLYFITRGNVKRGAPQVVLDFSTYQSPGARHNSSDESRLPSWVNEEEVDIDLAYVNAFVEVHGFAWTTDEPFFLLVPCHGGTAKPAIFCKVATPQATPIQSIQLFQVYWPLVANNSYLCLGFCATVTINHSTKKEHLVAVLDVAAPEVATWFDAWMQLAGPLLLFLVPPDLSQVCLKWLTTEPDDMDRDDLKKIALAQWQVAGQKLEQAGYALDNFVIYREELLNKVRNAAKAGHYDRC